MVRRLASMIVIAITLATTSPSAAHGAEIRLVARTDFALACLADQRSGAYRVETVDVVIESRVGGRPRTIWQSVDGRQFVVKPISQNPPWACSPVPVQTIPADWVTD